MFETAGSNKYAVTSHRSRVMITTFDFVPWVATSGMVAIMNGSLHGQALLYHFLPNHVTGDLMFKAIHALIKIGSVIRLTLARCLFKTPVAARKRTHQ